MTVLSIIRDKFRYYAKPYITYELVNKILRNFWPNYTLADLSRAGILSPIKQEEWYLNELASEESDWYVIWALYMWKKPYMFGWLNIYNRYHFTTQLAERYTIYNTEFSGQRLIAWARFIFVKQRPTFFYGIKKSVRQWYSVNFMSPERALIELFKKTDEDEFVTEMPSNVDKILLFKMIEDHASQTVLQRITNLVDDKKNSKR